MPRKSTSTIKKKLRPKNSKVSKRPKEKQEEQKKPFKFEFDDFIIENAAERIKLFAKPDANLTGEKQFNIRITKDETGKAQFDIIFIKTPVEGVGNIVRGLQMPSDNDIMTTFVVSPDDHNIDLIQPISYPSDVNELSTSVRSEASTIPVLPDRPEATLNFLETQYQKERDHIEAVGNYAHMNNITRYEKTRAEFLKEHRENFQVNGNSSFVNTYNAQQYLSHAKLEYNPYLFTEKKECVNSSPRAEPPVSQLRSDSTDSSYIIEDQEGRQFLVKRLNNDEAKSRKKHSLEDSKYIPNGESKKIHKKNNLTEKIVHNNGVSVEETLTKIIESKSKESNRTIRSISHISGKKSIDKTIRCQSKEWKTYGKKSTLDTETSMDPPDEPIVNENNIYESVSSSQTITEKFVSAMNLPTTTLKNDTQTNITNSISKPDSNQETMGMSTESSYKTFPSEMSFVLSSACQKVPKPKQAQVREVVSEILDYFDSDLIKSLMAQKIEDEREFIIKFMNHKGKYGKFSIIPKVKTYLSRL